MNYIDIIKNTFIENNYRSYLEIGCQHDSCFARIPAKRKIGVDPHLGGTHRMTSDEFFKQNSEMFDCIFIDGLHEAEQCYKDILNAILCLNGNGVIFVHDIHPESELMQRVPREVGEWTGDVWKAWKHLSETVPCEIIEHNVKYGLGEIHPDKDGKIFLNSNYFPKNINEMTYEEDYAGKNYA